MANITWKVEKLECIENGFGVDKLIQKVYYAAIGEETVNGVKYEGRTDGFANITPESSNLVSFADLDESTVIAWVWNNGVSKELAEKEVLRQIDTKKSTSPIITEFPWS